MGKASQRIHRVTTKTVKATRTKAKSGSSSNNDGSVRCPTCGKYMKRK